MSSVLATRKMAGAGNFFTVTVDISDYTVADGVSTASVTVSEGAFLVDLGERVNDVTNDRVLARVRDVTAADGSFTYVAVRDAAGAVGVAHVGAGTRN